MSSNIVKTRATFVLALVLSLLLAFGVTWSAGIAYATESGDLNAQVEETQKQVEESIVEYDKAVATLEGLEKDIEKNSSRIVEIEGLLPGQLERSNKAMKSLYLMQQQGYSILDMLLSSGSLTDFIVSLDYVNYIQQNNIDEITRLKTMQDELEAVENDLKTKKVQAQEEKDRAESSLSEATKARQIAQEKALAEAKAYAETQAQQSAAQSQPAEQAASDPAVETPSNVDWSSDKQVFVDSWGKRIDVYLAGSPLAGQGRTFAVAAWDYKVDPRWSPAISNTESSKGRNCFRSHNAWGWGQIDWPSWEVAIDAHVRGLARGYGYTISMESAKKYCPPNSDHWYNSTLSEMNKI